MPVVKQGGVLVRVQAAVLNAGDYFTVRDHPWLGHLYVRFPKPKGHVLGWDVAGRVDEVGADATRFKPGDEVFGLRSGTLAEYACATEDKFATKPANVSLEQAAAVPTAALTALLGLRDAGKVQAGQRVLINGASGGVGTFAVQIAKALGAEVTGVCSTRKVDLVRSLGADHLIDYTLEGFTRSGPRHDLILDNVGNRSFAECRRTLAPGGNLLPNSGHAGMGKVLMAFARSLYVPQQGRPFASTPKAEDLVALKELIEAEKVTLVIDRTYQLVAAPDALSYVGEGHARGKVVILVGPAEPDDGHITA